MLITTQNGEEQEIRVGEWNVDLFDLRENVDGVLFWMQRGPAYLRLLVHRQNPNRWRIVVRQRHMGRVLFNHALRTNHSLSEILFGQQPPASLLKEIIDFHGLEFDNGRIAMIGGTTAIVFSLETDQKRFSKCVPAWWNRQQLESPFVNAIQSSRDSDRILACVWDFLG